MADMQVRTWEAGSAEDLVNDALALGVPEASPRMIVNWTEKGLLGAPAFQKATRHGSEPRLYSPEQRRLFNELLQARQRSSIARVPHHTMIRPVLQVWMTDDTVVSDTQARRAWRTWARATGNSAQRRRSATARAVVDQFAHPEATIRQRRTAQLLIEQGEQTRNPDWSKIKSALTAVCSPWPAQPGQLLIERSVGTPELPFGVQDAVGMWMIGHRVARKLAAEQVPEDVLAQAKVEHRVQWADYLQNRVGFQGRAPRPEIFDLPENLEEQIKQQINGFVLVLGHVIGVDQQVFAETPRL